MLNTGGTERQRAGAWLKKRRVEVGATQQQIAKALNMPYYTFISQIEAGKARVPASHYSDYALALKLDARTFVKELLRYYDPEAWKILFNGAGHAARTTETERQDGEDHGPTP